MAQKTLLESVQRTTSSRRSAIGRLRGIWGRLRDWPGMLRDLRWQTARMLTARRTVTSRGLRFTLPCESWITHYRWATFNEKEPETLDWVDQHLRDKDCFLDIGANIGIYSLYAALRHPGIRVVAVEPEYANLHLLRDNIIANGLQARVELYALALSDLGGVSQLHVQDLTPGAALHTESPRSLERTETGRPVVCREGVIALTLDAFVEQTGLQPQAIKIDVDGGESRILSGGRHTLANPQLRSVIVEISKDPTVQSSCAEQLSKAGLRLVSRREGLTEANEIWVRP